MSSPSLITGSLNSAQLLFKLYLENRSSVYHCGMRVLSLCFVIECYILLGACFKNINTKIHILNFHNFLLRLTRNKVFHIEHDPFKTLKIIQNY